MLVTFFVGESTKKNQKKIAPGPAPKPQKPIGMNQNQEYIKEKDPAKLAAMIRSGNYGPMNMDNNALVVICGAPIFTTSEQADAEDALRRRMAGKDSLKIREWIAVHGEKELYKPAAKIMLRELKDREAKAVQAKTAMSWTRLEKDPANSIFKIHRAIDTGYIERREWHEEFGRNVPLLKTAYSCDKPKERKEMADLLQKISGMTNEAKTAYLKDPALLKTMFSKWNGYIYTKNLCHERLKDPKEKLLWCRIYLNTAVFENKEVYGDKPVEIVCWRFDGKPDLDAGIISGGTDGYIPPAAPKEPKPEPALDVWQTALKKAFAGDDALLSRYSAYKYAINDGSITLTIPVFLSPFAGGATLQENARQQADADLIDRGNLDLADFGGRQLIYALENIEPAPKPDQAGVYRMILLESFEEGSPCRRLAEDFETDLSKNILETEEGTYYVLPIRSGFRPKAHEAAKAKWEAKEGQPKLIYAEKLPQNLKTF